jgi:hypothetical protein
LIKESPGLFNTQAGSMAWLTCKHIADAGNDMIAELLFLSYKHIFFVENFMI